MNLEWKQSISLVVKSHGVTDTQTFPKHEPKCSSCLYQPMSNASHACIKLNVGHFRTDLKFWMIKPPKQKNKNQVTSVLTYCLYWPTKHVMSILMSYAGHVCTILLCRSCLHCPTMQVMSALSYYAGHVCTVLICRSCLHCPNMQVMSALS